MKIFGWILVGFFAGLAAFGFCVLLAAEAIQIKCIGLLVIMAAILAADGARELGRSKS